jgi:peptidase C25-like protein
MHSRVVILLACVVFATLGFAATTGTLNLHMPQAENSSRPFGDWVSDNDAGALNTFYRYFIEVPPSLTRLRVQIFDADVGQGGGGEDDAGRDRDRDDGYASTATYTLLDPAGTARTTRFTTGNAAGPILGGVNADNNWLDLYNGTGNNVLDTFATNVYTRNDGNNNWTGNWTETDAGGGGAGGATGGSIQVTGGQLRLQDVNAGSPNIFREVDLNGTPGLNMGMAFLTFNYTTSGTLDAGDNVLVEVSGNGGGSYTTLETFADDSTGNRSYDITAFIANNTRIRFSIPDGDLNAADEFFFVDNIQISDGPVTAGHWELDVDMTQGAEGNDINAIGIRADDGNTAGGGAGGTELNIYAESMVSLGVNPDPGDNTRTFSLFPWVTSGCSCSQNDFDLDTDSGTTGQAVYTSRSGPVNGFTQTFASAVLSADNVWTRNSTARFNDDNAADEYGIWTLAATINTYAGPSGNYETTYVGNEITTVNPPTTNPIVGGAGTLAAFRLYLPDDAGNAPLKPYLEQFVTQIGGPHTPALPVSTPTNFSVTVRITNPTAYPITFSAANLVTANVPGGAAGNNAVYVNPSLQVSQGAVVAQPVNGGTGNITWNPSAPGSTVPLAANGGTAEMSYTVRVTASAGNTIPVTGTPSSNGTTARYVDETANTTQTRATYQLGPICRVAVTQGLATHAMISKFELDARGGATTIKWSTASEAGTAGFNIYRANGERVNKRLIPASLKPQGGSYELLDTGNRDPKATYVVEEINSTGESHRYGPFNHFEGIDREKRKAERNASRPVTSEAAGSWFETNAKKETPVAVMVGVRQTGIVRVAYGDLAPVLETTASSIEKSVQKGNVSVTSNGTPIAWTTDGGAILFYGEKTTSIYSNDRVYRIELVNGGAKMATVNVSSAAAPVSSFTASQELETDAFFATILPLDPQGDFWFWEAFISGDPTYGRKTFNVNVPAVASASSATLNVRLQGAFKDGQHHAKVSLNGVPVGDATWQSFGATTAKFRIPSAVLRDGANEIVVEGVLEGDATFDIFYVDGFSVGYQKFARPEGGQIEVNRSGAVGAGPFASAPFVLDITNRNRPSILQGASFSGGIAALNTPPASKDLFFAQSFVTPSFLRGAAAPKLKTSQRADWVIVAPTGFRAGAESLAQLRQAEGLATLVVDLNQVYDEFAGGNSTPLAIRDFFTTAMNWKPAPKYFVLAGVGTVDYRGILLTPGPMPPMMTSTPDGMYASDSLFVDRNGDRLPDAAIGRIPVSTPAELSAYVAKLIANGQINSSSLPMVFSADAIDQSTDFRHASQIAEAPLAPRPTTHVYLDDLGGPASHDALMNAWHFGTPLMSWVGHGGLDQLSAAGILSSYDSPDLTSTGRLPVFVAMTCTINRFENGYVDPLGTALTKEAGAGAVAVWSASGLSQHSEASEIQNTFMRLAGQTPGARVGDLVVRALATHAGDTSSVYLLLGDPAIKIDLPAQVSVGGGHPHGE